MLRHRGWQPANIIEVTKMPGDRVFYHGRCYRIGEDGGWRDIDASPQPISHPNAGPAMPLHVHGWEVASWVTLVGIGAVCALAWWLA